MATALAGSLQELGLKKGDRMALHEKFIEFVVAFYAIEKLGGIVAWVTPTIGKPKRNSFFEFRGQGESLFLGTGTGMIISTPLQR